ncbi:MAG: nuclear transport factor 2 family protein [Burkholderiaceae bacterium]
MLAQDGRDCVMACERLCHDFGWHVDHRNHAEFLDLFADDSIFERGAQASQGRAEIERFLIERPADMVTRHLSVGVRIDPRSAETASGTCHCLVFRTSAEPGAAYPLATPPLRVVEYHDEYVRTASGWRFKHRRVSHVFAQA